MNILKTTPVKMSCNIYVNRRSISETVRLTAAMINSYNLKDLTHNCTPTCCVCTYQMFHFDLLLLYHSLPMLQYQLIYCNIKTQHNVNYSFSLKTAYITFSRLDIHIATPFLWNDLSHSIYRYNPLHQFKTLLKLHLFKQAFYF